MMKAFAKLLVITVGVVCLSSLAVVFVRWMGSKQVFRAPPHPWFEQSSWQILSPDLQELCATENVDKLVPNGDWIVALEILRDKNLEQRTETWTLPCPEGHRPLGTFLRAQNHRNWLLKIRAQETWGLDQLIEDLQPLNRDHHFAVMAEAQKVSMYLRKKAPAWLYAADSATLLRFHLFESLWIETAMDFWPDFVITDFTGKFQLDPRGASELRRRQKRVLWNRTQHSDGLVPPQIEIQGTMTNRTQ